MPLRKPIRKGISFLLSQLNLDGGVPAVMPNDVSGCWTTASCLETCLLSPFFPKEEEEKLRRMLMFLLETHITSEGWPLVKGGLTSSGMATGHCVAALAIARGMFSHVKKLAGCIDQAQQDAFKWLTKVQNEDGGWGVEPVGGPGTRSRVISTVYALRGYFALGKTCHDSNDVRRGVNYLINVFNPDGGCGNCAGAKSDSDNTARALTAILRSGKFGPSDPIVKTTTNFIFAQANNWRIDAESFVADGVPGQVVFHSNTPADILETLVRCECHRPEIDELIGLFLEWQEDDGQWYLRDRQQIDKSICMWSTAEAIYVLDLGQEQHFRFLVNHNQKRPSPLWRIVVVLLSVAIIGETLYIVGIYSWLHAWWNSLSDSWQQNIIFGVIIALVIGIVTPFLSDWLRSLVTRAKLRKETQTKSVAASQAKLGRLRWRKK